MSKLFRLPLLAILLAFPFLATAQYEDNDRGKDGLLGKVKSAKISSFEALKEGDDVTRGASAGSMVTTYTEAGTKISNNNYDQSGAAVRTQTFTLDKNERRTELVDKMGEMVIKKVTYEYDRKGNLLEEITYTGEGEIDRKDTYTYDKKGNLIEKVNYASSYGEMSISEKQVYEYDDAGNQVKLSSLDGQGTHWGSQEMKYDSNGNIIELTNLDDLGEIKVRQTMAYDSENNPTERVSFNAAGTMIRMVKLNRYGSPTEMISYDDEGNIRRKSGNRYDDDGKPVAELRYDQDGNESVDVEYRYKVDDQGNWIEQIAYQGGEPAFILARDLEYY